MTDIRELTETELDEVCGGFLNFTDSFNVVTQTNNAIQVGASVGGSVGQILGQLNFSNI